MNISTPIPHVLPTISNEATPLSPIIRDLAAGKTSLEDLVRDEIYLWLFLSQPQNHLLQEDNTKKAILARKDGYQNTILEIAKTFPELGVDYCLIKALRCYPHINTDVNIVVPKKDFAKIIQAYRSKGWSDRSLFARCKESLAERGKRKLIPPKGATYADIHLYPCVTWHGVPYLSYEWIAKNTLEITQSGITVITSNEVADLLVNYGHCLFERYNLSLGELYHNQMLRESLGENGRLLARNAAHDNGWGHAFDFLDCRIQDWWAGEQKPQTPYFLPRTDLYRIWMLRSIHNLKKGSLLPAIEEPLANFLWLSPIYDVYRFFKRRFGSGPINPKSLG
jgi:hypothetical protein